MSQVKHSEVSTKSIVVDVCQRLLTAAGLTLGISCIANLGLQVPAAWADPVAPAAINQVHPLSPGLANGTYLFGQATTRDQLGSAYMVFEVTEEHTIGAFYMPSSSFDCFYGEVEPEQLNLTVIDSYEQTESPYTVALTVSDSLVAGTAAGTLGLVGFHPIDQITAQDQAILNTCQANHGDLI